eukprot:scaffold569795_cov41-Prasinocladus_malaysianus.AAC.1
MWSPRGGQASRGISDYGGGGDHCLLAVSRHVPAARWARGGRDDRLVRWGLQNSIPSWVYLTRRQLSEQPRLARPALSVAGLKGLLFTSYS